jgi:hypothetical protein
MVLKTKKMVFFSEAQFERAVLNRARIDRCHRSVLPAASAQDKNFYDCFKNNIVLLNEVDPEFGTGV